MFSTSACRVMFEVGVVGDGRAPYLREPVARLDAVFHLADGARHGREVDASGRVAGAPVVYVEIL